MRNLKKEETIFGVETTINSFKDLIYFKDYYKDYKLTFHDLYERASVAILTKLRGHTLIITNEKECFFIEENEGIYGNLEYRFCSISELESVKNLDINYAVRFEKYYNFDFFKKDEKYFDAQTPFCITKIKTFKANNNNIYYGEDYLFISDLIKKYPKIIETKEVGKPQLHPIHERSRKELIEMNEIKIHLKTEDLKKLKIMANKENCND